MQMLILLAIFLSATGCKNPAGLPPIPNGLHCTHYLGMFYCNEINNPDAPQQEFKSDSVEMEKAQCQPLETFERYSKYVQELKDLAEKKCNFQ